MSYCFRILLKPSRRVKLNIDQAEWPLGTSLEEGVPNVSLKSASTETSIEDAEEIVILGVGYPTADAANEAALDWRSTIMAAFASIGFGADFGDRAPEGGFTAAGLEALEQQHSRRVLNSVHGILVYECDPPPLFVSLSAEGVVGKPSDQLQGAIQSARRLGYRLSSHQELAYELYGASFSQKYADSRFMLLSMALETLISASPRDESVREHVQRLITETEKSGLPESEVKSLTDSLRWLLDESIGQAGRRLARSLGARPYMGKLPADFFTDCYEVRSRLVHGHSPRPSRQEVDSMAAELERFVGDLLAGPLIWE